MSKESAKSFIQRVQHDEHLRNKVIALGKNLDAMINFAAAHGHIFDLTAFNQAVCDMGYGSSTAELNDEELEQVAGGLGLWFGCFPGQSSIHEPKPLP